MSDKTKKILWRVLQAFIIFIMNGASFAWLVFNFYGNGEVQTPLGIIEYSYWQTLELKFRIIVYCLAIAGAFGSFFWVKWLYKKNYNEKLIDKQNKIDDDRTKKQNEIFKKIMEK